MIYTHLAAAVIAALAAWFFQDNRYTAELAELRLEHANAVIKATSTLRAEQHVITTKYQGALNAARTRETVLRRNADLARTESERLRAQLSDAARRIADAPPAAVLEYATALGAVFEDCRAAYAELVPKADGHAGDARTLREAWPVMGGQ